MICISLQSMWKYVALIENPSPLALTPNSVFSALSEVYLLLKVADASGSSEQKYGRAELLPPDLYPAELTAKNVRSSLGV